MSTEAEPRSPQQRLVHELSARRDSNLSALRTALAVGGYLLGDLDGPSASEVAGTDRHGFEELLSRAGAGAAATTMGPTPPAPLLSVVVPVYNEEENLPILVAELAPVLESIDEDYEIIFVDDGSHDRSVPILLGMRLENPRLKVVRLSRNFGHQAALSAGIGHATGQAVVLMDADLQDPPGLLPRFVEEWRAGNEVVYAVRTKRKEGALKRTGYWAFYRALRRLAEIDIPLDSGDFCLMDRAVVDALVDLPEKNRFLRGLRTWVGFRQVGVVYERPARRAGEVKYTMRTLVRLALSGLLAFSSAPLRLASYLGFLTAVAGVMYLGFAVVAQLTAGGVPEGWTSTVAIVLVLGGAQLLVTGVLGEYLSKVYEETKQRPVYLVRDTHGLRSTRDG